MASSKDEVRSRKGNLGESSGRRKVDDAPEVTLTEVKAQVGLFGTLMVTLGIILGFVILSYLSLHHNYPVVNDVVPEKRTVSDLKWWQTSIIYHIYPRSFQDSNGDGVGDLKGIQSRLDYLKDLGVGAIWLSPVYKSPMADFGYDVSDHIAIDPIFGTMKDMENLVEAAHQRGLKVIMDIVPNHTSNKHKWFLQSRKGGADNKFSNYYVWHSGKIVADGKRTVPNNWVACFGGSMWEWDEVRKEYYLHQFVKEQPDLNYRNKDVEKEMLSIYEFWLKKGVDGFRVDALSHLYESTDLTQDEPRSFLPNALANQSHYFNHIHTSQTIELEEGRATISRWRELVDAYGIEHKKDIFMVIEHTVADVKDILPYYNVGMDFPFNFNLTQLNRSCDGLCVEQSVVAYIDALPEGKWPNWVTGNHDSARITQRMGADFANALNMLLLLLPGTPFTYYGEEIAMKSIHVSFEDTVDPFGRSFGAQRYMEVSRDPSRAPMQWSSAKHAGFSTSPLKTWLPVHADYRKLNVEAQSKEGDPTSPLQLYKQLARLRINDAFQMGGFDTAVVNTYIFSFIRHIKGQRAYLVSINFGHEVSTDSYVTYAGKFAPHGQFVPYQAKVLHVSGEMTAKHLIPDNIVSTNSITLAPGEGIVLQFMPRKGSIVM